MDKAHDIQSIHVSGTTLLLQVDGKRYEIDLAAQSQRLAKATPEQRKRFEVSPTGYGIHWPDLDEDLSIDGLIGATHAAPLAARKGA
jgi:hypothetical protein